MPKTRPSILIVPTVVLALCAVIFSGVGAPAAKENGRQIAVFAGGCFWCVESDFDKVPGVLKTISGYTGGHLKNPTYKQVTRENTGHREAVQITFDPKKVTYEKLLHIFWRTVDPTDQGGQFCDRGHSYTTAIYATTKEQRRLAELSKKEIEKAGTLKQNIVTPIEDAKTFYPAEGYHQDYYKKNPGRYNFYRYSCGRNAKVKRVWGKEAFSGIPGE